MTKGSMNNPIRIQRKRTKGWKMPPNTVYVGRGSRWGNRFVIGKDGDARACIKKYVAELMPYTHHSPNNNLKELFISEANLRDIQYQLRGKNLACWCPLDQPCHADFLLETANEEELI